MGNPFYQRWRYRSLLPERLARILENPQLPPFGQVLHQPPVRFLKILGLVDDGERRALCVCWQRVTCSSERNHAPELFARRRCQPCFVEKHEREASNRSRANVVTAAALLSKPVVDRGSERVGETQIADALAGARLAHAELTSDHALAGPRPARNDGAFVVLGIVEDAHLVFVEGDQALLRALDLIGECDSWHPGVAPKFMEDVEPRPVPRHTFFRHGFANEGV